jgi:hypothetical protein
MIGVQELWLFNMCFSDVICFGLTGKLGNCAQEISKLNSKYYKGKYQNFTVYHTPVINEHICHQNVP